MNFQTSRASAIEKLDNFIEKNLSDYSKQRNFDYGPDKRSNVSCLSPYITHGIISELEVIDKSLKRYFNEWSYKHPSANDFKRIVEKESGIELDWYFEYFINTTKTIDYSIHEIQGNENNTQIILKKGEMPMPIEINIFFQNGSVSKYYIPTVLMRGEKEVETKTMFFLFK